jgi:hypothetical protein
LERIIPGDDSCKSLFFGDELSTGGYLTSLISPRRRGVAEKMGNSTLMALIGKLNLTTETRSHGDRSSKMDCHLRRVNLGCAVPSSTQQSARQSSRGFSLINADQESSREFRMNMHQLRRKGASRKQRTQGRGRKQEAQAQGRGRKRER